ncbi:Na+/H+ antiporter NhaA [Streptomyces griseus]|uniref:Na+/H+ antiporter NhaA n=1 Tax=Streptomyces griseus TaxID=1911 RepID=UPI0036B967EF
MPLTAARRAGRELVDRSPRRTALGGKFAGILGATWLTARFTSARLNPRIAWPDIAGIGILGGIGFTVPC